MASAAWSSERSRQHCSAVSEHNRAYQLVHRHVAPQRRQQVLLCGAGSGRLQVCLQCGSGSSGRLQKRQLLHQQRAQQTMQRLPARLLDTAEHERVLRNKHTEHARHVLVTCGGCLFEQALQRRQLACIVMSAERCVQACAHTKPALCAPSGK